MIETRIHRLTPDNTVFHQNEGGFLDVTAEGKRYSRVSIIRAFPFTDPDVYLSVRDADLDEIGIIENIHDFDDDTAKLLQRHIDIRYFTPKIVAVRSVKDRAGIATMDCDTDKGHTVFQFRTGGESVIRLSETRIVFTDLDGNRYEIADLSALTAQEQKKLDLYL